MQPSPSYGNDAHHEAQSRIAKRFTALADACAYLYVGLLTLAVAANIGAAAVLLWTLCACSIAYRKARA